MTHTDPVRWDELTPAALTRRLSSRAVAYLPLGTLEWHGPHLPLGVDAMISEALLTRTAQRYGGVVLPPIHLGPDRSQIGADGARLVGMDYDDTTVPAHRLAGSAYWVEPETFASLVLALLHQLKRAGVAAVFADGHGPSRWQWSNNLQGWSETTGLALIGVTKDREVVWRSQIDHAARNETSLMLAARPELVDLSALQPGPRESVLKGVAGDDPQKATASEGEEILDESSRLIDRWLKEAGW